MKLTNDKKLKIAIRALRDIVDPISKFERYAKAEGAQLNASMIGHILNDPYTYKQIASDALKAMGVKE